MFRLILHRPFVFLTGLCILCLLGAAAMLRLPVQMIPDIEPRMISVETTWAGATPQDVEADILLDQEQALRRIADLVRLTSLAEFGVATVDLEFPHDLPIDQALLRVRNALDQVSDAPETADEPRIIVNASSDDPFLYFGISRRDAAAGAEPLPIREEAQWIDRMVRPRLERVSGVGDVQVIGGVERQVHITLDPMKMAARRIGIADVRQALQLRNRDLSAGDTALGTRLHFVRTLGRFDSLATLEDMVIDRRNGDPVHLRDIGRAAFASEEPRSLAFANGAPILLVGIGKRPGANVIAVKAAIEDVVAEFNDHLLAGRGLTMRLLSEDVRYVEQSVAAVLWNIAVGAVLAAGVLFLFLRSRTATLVAAAGVPICVLAAGLVLLLTGRSLNVISLSGIAFAIGMTLDNSIVALESITRHQGAGKARRTAVLDGMAEVWPAILSSTLTTVMVFLPLAFLDLEAGDLYSDIAIAISAAIVMSMVVAMTAVPMAAHRWPLASAPTAPRPAGRDTAMTRLVRWMLTGLGRPVALLAATGATVAAILLLLVPPAEYLPEGEEATVFSFLAAPPGSSMDAMEAVWRAVDGPLSTATGDSAAEAYAEGRTDVPPLAMNLSFLRPGYMRFVSEPRSGDDTEALIDATTGSMRSISGMRAFATRGSIFSGNSGDARSIDVELSGSDLPLLYDTARAVLDRADGLFAGGQVTSDPPPPALRLSQPVLQVRPDWSRASELGVSQAAIGEAVRAHVDGAFADEYLYDDDTLDIYLRTTEAAQGGDLNGLRTLLLDTAGGGPLPLSAVAEVRQTVGPASIARIDGMRTVTVVLLPPRSVALETGIARTRTELIETLRAEGVIPASVSTRITGAGSDLDTLRDALGGGFLLAVAIAYLVLVAIFSHWGYPLIIMAVVPVGLSGGIVGLWLFNAVGGALTSLGLRVPHQPFDVLTMLGFLVLVGTVVNNPILIVERVIANLRRAGMDLRAAVTEAVQRRLRPVAMTTATTIVGLSPLVLVPSAGTELYRGIGAIVLSGLLSSSIVSVTVLPVVLFLVFQVAQWLKRPTPSRRASRPPVR